MTVKSLGGGLWFPNYHIFRVNNKKLMIVLAMLTGFNKIGSLERGRPRAKQLCAFVYVSVCVCGWMCVCVCFCASYTVCVSRVSHVSSVSCGGEEEDSLPKHCQFKLRKCKTNRKYTSNSDPGRGVLYVYFLRFCLRDIYAWHCKTCSYFWALVTLVSFIRSLQQTALEQMQVPLPCTAINP